MKDKIVITDPKADQIHLMLGISEIRWGEMKSFVEKYFEEEDSLAIIITEIFNNESFTLQERVVGVYWLGKLAGGEFVCELIANRIGTKMVEQFFVKTNRTN